ncbi:MAG: aminomethyl transferase family protein [Blastocatellia bacterium]|nr:aminomethyl transferase family protein [Blastocatellia bacterium]
MPIGTAFHERTFSLCESLNYREWSGFYAVSSYEPHHEHEYNAIRNASALIDISPLYKYRITGKDAERLVDRIITRNAQKMQVGQVYYTPWCDEHGKVIDDGTVSRLAEDTFRWTAADPSIRWFHQNARGLDVTIEDISEETAALALQGPTSGGLLMKAAEADVENLKYFRVTSGTIAGVPVDISRTGYTGDLGYEVWMPWDRAITVWDAMVRAGEAFDVHAAGMLALDVARIEAGLLMIDVDFNNAKRAQIEAQKYTPSEMGLGRLVSKDKARFVGRRRSRTSASAGTRARSWGSSSTGAASRRCTTGRAAGDAVDGVSGGGAGVLRGQAGGKGDVDDVVAGAQEDDRAGDDRSRVFRGGDAAGDGDDGGGGAAPGAGDGGEDAVLQSTAEDADAVSDPVTALRLCAFA